MKKPFLPVRLFIATVAGIGFASFLIAQPSSAQLSSPADSFPNNSTTDQNTDPFSRTNSDNFNPLDLIHRANFGTLNWNSEQRNEELNSAAAAFKARQQQVLQCQQAQQTTPLSSTTPSAVTTSSKVEDLKARQQTLQCQQVRQATPELKITPQSGN